MNAELLVGPLQAGSQRRRTRLRGSAASFLSLAVRGKLVPQDPSDEPACELLKRIAREKARQVKAGEARKLEIDPLIEKDVPFPIPLNWAWTRLGSIADWGSGSTPPRGNLDFYGGGITWLKSGELNDNRALAGSEETVTQLAIDKGSFEINKSGDVLLAMYGATIGKAAILAESAVTNQAVCGCTPFPGVSNQFLFLFLLSQREQFHSASEGGAQPNISKVKIVWTPFPLPPHAEQHRIVAKVDELMALCDRLQSARGEREAVRDRLVAASLARLNAPDPETFVGDARFALHALPVLTTRPDQIKQFRQTILNLAVHGKLVKQDPRDEPASALLVQIEREKARLARAGKIKRQEPFDSSPEQRGIFDLPKSWEWVPATFPAYIVSDLDSKIQTKEVSPSGKFPVVDQGKVFIRGYCDNIDKVIKVREPLILFGDHTRETKLIDFDFVVGADGVKLLHPICVFAKYYYLSLRWLPLDSRGYGRHFKLLRASFIPLPPLAEQRRIVAKVDQLMALCDRLESSLDAVVSSGRLLLEALLAEALAPAEEHDGS